MALSDQYWLSQNTTFQQRVQEALEAACIAIGNEGWAVPFHRERASFAQAVLDGQVQNVVTLFSESVATDANVIADATQNGTVAVTSANSGTQQALVTDAHINAAISGEFNTFIREPGS